MAETKQIPLFWWSETRLMGKQKENYGDLLSKYLAEKISNKEVEWVQPKKQKWYKLNKSNFLSTGSIIHHASKQSIIWGSGIIDQEQAISKADFRAVRGPRTRSFLQGKGYKCPAIYGDPALLLPRFYSPKITKKYRVGIIPHYNDFEKVTELYEGHSEILVIDLMTLDIEKVTDLILECEQTISSSLHGIIVSQAYGIPSVRVRFSNKIFGNGIKYIDYLESVGLEPYPTEFIDTSISFNELESIISSNPNMPSVTAIERIRDGLMKSCPFIE